MHPFGYAGGARFQTHLQTVTCRRCAYGDAVARRGGFQASLELTLL